MWGLRQGFVRGHRHHSPIDDPAQALYHSILGLNLGLLFDHLVPQCQIQLLKPPQLHHHALVVLSELLEQLLYALVFRTWRLRRCIFLDRRPHGFLQGRYFLVELVVFVLQPQYLLLLLFCYHLTLLQIIVLDLMKKL